MTQQMIEVQEESLRRSSPLGLYGAPQDIANCVAFLGSDDAKYINGVNFIADGGAILSNINIIDT